MSSEFSLKIDLDLIQEAKDFLAQEYTQNVHHVAVALSTSGGVYKSLHMDSAGFDICAEPIAIHNALQNGEKNFFQIVAVTLFENKDFKIISPCGNCRQILFEYIPEVQVIIDEGSKLKLFKPSDLLPNPYR